MGTLLIFVAGYIAGVASMLFTLYLAHRIKRVESTGLADLTDADLPESAVMRAVGSSEGRSIVVEDEVVTSGTRVLPELRQSGERRRGGAFIDEDEDDDIAVG